MENLILTIILCTFSIGVLIVGGVEKICRVIKEKNA
jgi:hypothetical protein